MAGTYGCDGRIWRLASPILAIRSYDGQGYGLVRAEISRLVWLLRKFLGGIPETVRPSQWRVGAFLVLQPAELRSSPESDMRSARLPVKCFLIRNRKGI